MIKIKFETKFFITGMKTITPKTIQGAKLGMQKAVEHYKNDALTKPPACPRKTGWLAEHHVTNVTVLGKLIKGTLSVVDTPYAPSLHEGISRWGTKYAFKTPGTGMKWIESKMLIYVNKYAKDILSGVNQGLISWSAQVKGFIK